MARTNLQMRMRMRTANCAYVDFLPKPTSDGERRTSSKRSNWSNKGPYPHSGISEQQGHSLAYIVFAQSDHRLSCSLLNYESASTLFSCCCFCLRDAARMMSRNIIEEENIQL